VRRRRAGPRSARRWSTRVAGGDWGPGRAHRCAPRARQPESRPATPSPPLQEDLVSPIDRRSDFYRRRASEAGPSPRGRSPAPHSLAGRRSPLLTPPNVLTLLRLALVPVFFALWFAPGHKASGAAAGVFILAAVTDWADGYLARRLALTSAFGAFLDPVADKVMVSTALVLAAATPPSPLTPAELAAPVALIVCREVAMSSLREWAATSGGGAHGAVRVNSLGKWKTAAQMVAMSGLLALRRGGERWPRHRVAVDAGVRASLALLWAGAALGVISLAYYTANVWQFFIYPHGPPEAATATARRSGDGGARSHAPAPARTPAVTPGGTRRSSRLAS